MPASDIAAIEAVLQTYFDGLYEGDTGKLASAFHPCSHLYWDKDGVVQDLPREQWFEMVRGRGSAKAKGLARDDRILMLDQSGPETALAKVACQIPPRYFTDYLVFLKTGEGWKIVSKVYRADVRA
ncbi:nuclear transport factor 2 family protein [Roseomonas eburnea]|uniref:Nuclear transport factor 2 family protein n=1 Tax=Neoroseomonas eburnea TaxID=1346889 RepID=A0A9X9X6B7_9PROT|nr:nuclear transport factor 2 family protein [Neoroseomonas eburnea]MBR0679253.1 nuclear transport factor 2 family protein [Neoroseomonas eburnea]